VLFCLLRLFHVKGVTRMLVMAEYHSLAHTKAHLSELVDLVESVDEHVVITRRGKPAALLISVDEYEGLMETLDIMATPGALEEIRQAEAEIDAGNFYTAEQIREEFLKKPE
jgi:antitoxin YefM